MIIDKSDFFQKNKFFIKAILLWLFSLSVMCTGVVSPALPIIKKSFAHLPNALFLTKMMVVLPNLFIAIFAPIIGYFSVKIGRKRILITALLIYAIAGTAGIYLKTIPEIIISRMILGIAIAGIMTITTNLVADYFDSYERSTLVGMQTTVMSIGSTVYALISGFIADVNWRYIFFLYGISLLILPLVIKFIFDPTQVVKKNENHSQKIILQNNAAIFLICGINFLVMVMFYMIPLQVPFLLYGMSTLMNAKKVALATSTQVLVAAIISLRYRRLKKNRDFSVMCSTAFGFIALSYVVISNVTTYYGILIAMMICGIGMGIMMPNTTLWIISITKPEKRPLFLGIFTTSTFLGKVFSPIIAMPLILNFGTQKAFMIDAYIMLFISISVMYINDYFKRVNVVHWWKEARKVIKDEKTK